MLIAYFCDVPLGISTYKECLKIEMHFKTLYELDISINILYLF